MILLLLSLHSPRHISVAHGVPRARSRPRFISAKFQSFRCQIEPSAYSTRLITTFSAKRSPDLFARVDTLTTSVGPDKLKACNSFALSGFMLTPQRNCRRVRAAGFERSMN